MMVGIFRFEGTMETKRGGELKKGKGRRKQQQQIVVRQKSWDGRESTMVVPASLSVRPPVSIWSTYIKQFTLENIYLYDDVRAPLSRFYRI
jgi:hypothetical protein